ncbi:MAG TPA: 3,4-dehydroadipyl-CoA semialdehyde dehydrogenase [Alphaproteobacteria bacterium]|nr:3,4-dehydroadipyl-CoA semialdehyde dehydrogenase [Alphaproteobacteria bacterium]
MSEMGEMGAIQTGSDGRRRLGNYLAGAWRFGTGPGSALVDPTTGDELVWADAEGVDLKAALGFARLNGGTALRAMSYAARAQMLDRIAEALAARRAEFEAIARANSGNTKLDAAIDIEGAIGTLKFFARAGSKLGEARVLRETPPVRLGRDENFQALHIGVPLEGVALHINAFNFPAWNLWEKAAVSLLAGVPVLAKPATATAWLAVASVEAALGAGVLPPGALSIIAGRPRDLLDHLETGDAIVFTGSAATADVVRTHARVIARGVRVNIEADSLNSSILGPEATPGSPAFDLFVTEIVREMTVKAGQKCTAIRRVFVPASLAGSAGDAIAAKLAALPVGDPRLEEVRMGPVVSKAQQQSVLAGIAQLAAETRPRYFPEKFTPLGADGRKGAFVPPTLLEAADPMSAHAPHEVEVFGPVATLMPYATAAQAVELAARGGGSLAASVFSEDRAFLAHTARALAPSHGRVLAVDPSIGKSHTGHGIVMPMCTHGGPGRAGGGEELGGLRALAFYHRRAAVQGARATLEALMQEGVDFPAPA